jgi:hypothetical protein
MEDTTPTESESTALCFGMDGGWRTLTPDPTDEALGEGGDMIAALEQLGFKRWTRIGDDGECAVPLAIDVFVRTEAMPFYAVQLQGNQYSNIETVYADDLPAMMQLLGRWAPAAQAAAAVHLAARFDLGPDHRGGAEKLAALLTETFAKPAEKIAEKVDDVRRALVSIDEEVTALATSSH